MARAAGKRVPAAEARRAQVARLIFERKTTREIAAELGCSIGTVSRDRSILTKQWRKQSVENVDAVIARDLADLDRIERLAVEDFIASGKPGSRSTKYLDIILKAKDRRAKLMGLDQLSTEAVATAAAAAAVAASAVMEREIEELDDAELVEEYERTVRGAVH